MTTPDSAVPPWGATVAGVQALIPDARIYAAGTVPPGGRGVTDEQVRAWLVALTGRASIQLDGWERLSQTPDDGETRSDRDQFLDLARDAVHNGAASYTEAARFPEQQGKSATSYAAVLWQRYTDVLAELAAWLTARLAPAAGPGDTPTDPTTGLPRVAEVVDYAFPPPSFLPGLRF